VCIGNHFVMMEIAIVLGVLVHRVELSISPGFELKVTPLFTLRNDGVRLTVRRRAGDRFHASLGDGPASAGTGTA
jgi:cytochrome P450